MPDSNELPEENIVKLAGVKRDRKGNPIQQPSQPQPQPQTT
jgi:hypothetical protein